MEKLGIVKHIFSATKNDKKLPRPKKEQLEFIKDYGIKNDKFANKNLDRTVMIVGQIAYNLAKKEDINLEYGSLGENILVDFDPHDLDKDDTLYINGVELQRTEPCSLCTHLSRFDKRLPRVVQYHRGIYFKIKNGGIIHENLPIYKKRII
jgi:MOSC domain-containing protein YiiM